MHILSALWGQPCSGESHTGGSAITTHDDASSCVNAVRTWSSTCQSCLFLQHVPWPQHVPWLGRGLGPMVEIVNIQATHPN